MSCTGPAAPARAAAEGIEVEEMIHLESRLSDGSVPLGVRSALRQAIDVVTGEGIRVIDKPVADYVSLAARGKPIAVYVWPSRLSIALDPQRAEDASDSESALTLEKDSNVTWFVHGSFSSLTGARRLDLVTSLLGRSLSEVCEQCPRRWSLPTRSAAARTGRVWSAALPVAGLQPSHDRRLLRIPLTPEPSGVALGSLDQDVDVPRSEAHLVDRVRRVGEDVGHRGRQRDPRRGPVPVVDDVDPFAGAVRRRVHGH